MSKGDGGKSKSAVNSRFWLYILIVGYSAGLVALGAKEINKRFSKKVSTEAPRKIIELLRDDMRARFQPKSLPKNESLGTGQRGSWDEEDQKSLTNLLDKVAP